MSNSTVQPPRAPAPAEPDALGTDDHRRRRDALIALTANPALAANDLPAALRLITDTAADTLHVARASIWRYDDDRDVIRCLDLYEPDRRAHSCGTILFGADYPNYFRALADSDVVAADDAQRDARTAELTPSYLAPLDIVAMLDAAIRVGTRVIGVLCHEHIGAPREWTADEQTLALALANIVSLVLEREERHQAERRLSAVVEAAANAFVLADDVGTITLVNAGAERLFGAPRAALVGQPLARLIPKRFRGQHSAQYARFMASSETRSMGAGRELVALRSDGAEIPAEIGLNPMTIGERRFVLASLVDISERKNAERLRFAIGYALSHELNTPLSGIVAGIELLQTESADPAASERQDILAVLVDSAARLRVLVERNLDFAKLELLGSQSHGIEPPDTSRDCRASIRALATAIADQHGRAADLALELGPGAIAISERWLTRLVTELVENAYKFSTPGTLVRVATRAHEQFALIVEDGGRGMTTDQIAGIEAFIQFDRAHYEQQGVGLGLHLARRVAELHNGKLTVGPRAGGGTRVTVVLPLVAAALA